MTDFLLNSNESKELYDFVKNLPIIDYHNHLSVLDIAQNRRFTNIYDLWIKPDPYKHRAMRMSGVSEKYITGDTKKSEKFKAWCSIFPNLIGNPLYVWSKMELEKIFGITESPCQDNAEDIYEKANLYLKDNEVTAMGLLSQFNVELACPCVSLCDDVSCFLEKESLSPSLRADDITSPTTEFIHKLESLTIKINSLADYKKAITKRLDTLKSVGCKISDHALDNGFKYFKDDGKNEARFNEILAGNILIGEDKEKLFSYILRFVFGEYSKNHFTVQLHIGAERYTSTRLRNIAGAQGGFAGIGNSVDASSLTQMLDDFEQNEFGLPKIILFTLNPSDNALISVLSGSYSKDNVKGLISQGPAWWWCDHKYGICEVLENVSSFGLLSNFVGMTTDSRSFLSFVRHDYFRRILCQWLSEKYKSNELCCTLDDLKRLSFAICYNNLKQI